MGLYVDVARRRSVLIVRLSGELDHHTATQVRQRLENELSKEIDTNLVLNLEDLTFMDSSGLGVVLGRYRQISQLGGQMAVCSVQPSIHRLFEMSGLFKVFSFYENEEQAIQACGVAS
ncbi:anti-anti-sigma regulatory factor, SpoIIAA [Marininema mesophilum]|uniref:Anti-sigma F factor antagonist n=1 Tax=Marininema mesophilum TaxID=1048340 RepID=A0A1H2UI11_9BACL|nr:anti-sigma F factor antagonist [Marininema mesophilum]SDW55740.1 anti-anti-sigma regulatory factor, SpoIIAA [Marininema mesophilum]